MTEWFPRPSTSGSRENFCSTPQTQQLSSPATPTRSPADEATDAVDAPTTARFKSLVQKHSATLRVAGILISKRETQKRAALHSVRNERKAIRVLGAMFAIFVVCWAPFFSINLAMGVCEDCLDVHPLLFKVFLWLGYVSSTLNPIVYTVFNRTFRLTFVRILLTRTCCTHQT